MRLFGLLMVFCLVGAADVPAQEKGSISGFVVDAGDGIGVFGAVVPDTVYVEVVRE